MNKDFISTLDPQSVEVEIQKLDQAEMDEMWSFVAKKGNQRWLWHAIDHQSGKVLAYVFGNRKNQVFLKLKETLKPYQQN